MRGKSPAAILVICFCLVSSCEEPDSDAGASDAGVRADAGPGADAGPDPQHCSESCVDTEAPAGDCAARLLLPVPATSTVRLLAGRIVFSNEEQEEPGQARVSVWRAITTVNCGCVASLGPVIRVAHEPSGTILLPLAAPVFERSTDGTLTITEEVEPPDELGATPEFALQLVDAEGSASIPTCVELIFGGA